MEKMNVVVYHMAYFIGETNRMANLKQKERNMLCCGRVYAFRQILEELGGVSIRLTSANPDIRKPFIFKQAIVDGEAVPLYKQDWNDIYENLMKAIEGRSAE